jgi:TRAP-type transport system periplasmic protein
MLKNAKILGLAAIAWTFSWGAQAAPMEIVFAISTPQGAMGQQTGARFTDICNQKLAGKAKVAYYHSDQMGPDKDLMQKLKLGTVHLTYMASVMPQYVEEAAIFDMPFLVKDRDHVLKMEKEFVRTVFAEAAAKKGYKYIALWENGFRHMTNNVRPITTPADLNGVKIRTPRSKWRLEMFRAFGANPTPMPFSEVFVGLQTGAIDGQENPLTHIAANKLEEVQKFLSISSHVYSPNFVIAFERHWNNIPADIRAVLEETAEAVRPWTYEAVAAADARLVGELESKGMQVNEVDREAFVKASAPVYELFDKEIPGGKKMIDDILALAK